MADEIEMPVDTCETSPSSSRSGKVGEGWCADCGCELLDDIGYLLCIEQDILALWGWRRVKLESPEQLNGGGPMNVELPFAEVVYTRHSKLGHVLIRQGRGVREDSWERLVREPARATDLAVVDRAWREPARSHGNRGVKAGHVRWVEQNAAPCHRPVVGPHETGDRERPLAGGTEQPFGAEWPNDRHPIMIAAGAARPIPPTMRETSRTTFSYRHGDGRDAHGHSADGSKLD